MITEAEENRDITGTKEIVPMKPEKSIGGMISQKSETKEFTNIKILNLFFIFFNYIFEKVALNVLKTYIL